MTRNGLTTCNLSHFYISLLSFSRVFNLQRRRVFAKRSVDVSRYSCPWCNISSSSFHWKQSLEQLSQLMNQCLPHKWTALVPVSSQITLSFRVCNDFTTSFLTDCSVHVIIFKANHEVYLHRYLAARESDGKH